MNAQPLVSIVIPCFNQSRYLPAALSSVHRQDWPNVESIVIDDGSSDDTSRIAHNFGATKVRRQGNQGLSAARNAGLSVAQGEFVVFLDADDELFPCALREGIEAFRRHPAASCVAGRCRLIDAVGRPLPTTHPKIESADLYAELLKINFVWTPGAAMFRADAITVLGGFPSAHAAAADYAVILAFARQGQLVLENRDVVRYRKHDANMSRDPILMLQATLSVLEREGRNVPPGYRRALGEARWRWRAFYGEQLSVEIRREWRTTKRPAALARDALFLFRHCPGAVATHCWRKLTRVVRQLPPTDLETVPHQSVPVSASSGSWDYQISAKPETYSKT